MPNQILDKKEIVKDRNDKIELEKQAEKLTNEITNLNEENINISKDKLQKDNNNTLKFLDTINLSQEQIIGILHDISKKNVELQKNVIDINQLVYTHILDSTGTKTYNNINKSIINSTINITNLINENILNNIERYTKSTESFQLYYKQIYQNFSDHLNLLNKVHEK